MSKLHLSKETLVSLNAQQMAGLQGGTDQAQSLDCGGGNPWPEATKDGALLCRFPIINKQAYN